MMIRAFVSFWKTQWRNVGYVLSGVLITILVVNILGPDEGQIVRDPAEAEGPAFNNPNVVDLYSHVEVLRLCPKKSQRYAWRYETVNGKRVQHAYALFSTSVPFFPDIPDVIISGPAYGVPDPVNGGWQERTNSEESCPWLRLPGVLRKWLFASVKKGPDVPTNFIGGPDQKAAP